MTRLDFGPEASNGIATTLPPREGEAYPHFVPSVDPDGNELSGIRLPDVTVPLATYTGWNLRHPQIGAPERLMSLIGSTIPFPATEGERAAKGDPRRSIEARYPRQDRLPRPGTPRGAVPDRRRLPVARRPGAHSRAVGSPLGSARIRAGIRRREIARDFDRSNPSVRRRRRLLVAPPTKHL